MFEMHDPFAYHSEDESDGSLDMDGPPFEMTALPSESKVAISLTITKVRFLPEWVVTCHGMSQYQYRSRLGEDETLFRVLLNLAQNSLTSSNIRYIDLQIALEFSVSDRWL